MTKYIYEDNCSLWGAITVETALHQCGYVEWQMMINTGIQETLKLIKYGCHEIRGEH